MNDIVSCVSCGGDISIEDQEDYRQWRQATTERATEKGRVEGMQAEREAVIAYLLSDKIILSSHKPARELLAEHIRHGHHLALRDSSVSRTETGNKPPHG